MRVLLIEDEEDLAAFIVSLLKKAGLAVDHASDGERGSFLARSNHYDLVITDYILPKLDGRSLIKEIRDDGRQMPILMLSVRQSAADKTDVLNVGADDYLAKPFSSEELLARVQALGRRSPHIKNRILTFRNIKLCQSLRILNHYLANYLGRFLIKFKVNFLGDCIFRLV